MAERSLSRYSLDEMATNRVKQIIERCKRQARRRHTAVDENYAPIVIDHFMDTDEIATLAAIGIVPKHRRQRTGRTRYTANAFADPTVSFHRHTDVFADPTGQTPISFHQYTNEAFLDKHNSLFVNPRTDKVNTESDGFNFYTNLLRRQQNYVNSRLLLLAMASAVRLSKYATNIFPSDGNVRCVYDCVCYKSLLIRSIQHDRVSTEWQNTVQDIIFQFRTRYSKQIETTRMTEMEEIEEFIDME